MRQPGGRWSSRKEALGYAAGVVVVLVVVAGLSVFVVAVAPEWLASIVEVQDTNAEEVGRVRTALLAFLAGTVAVIGAFYTARSYELSKRGQITDRFTRAIEQLGSDKPEIRVGAIYALERIALDSKADHFRVMEVLTAYIRENAPWPKELAGFDLERRLPDDIQAVIAVIGRRKIRNDRYLLNLSGSDLRGAKLAEQKLQRAILKGTNLRKAEGLHRDEANDREWGPPLRCAVFDAATLWPHPDFDRDEATSLGATEEPERSTQGVEG
jgi:Pentapeptide repeats (8 copies)